MKIIVLAVVCLLVGIGIGQNLSSPQPLPISTGELNLQQALATKGVVMNYSPTKIPYNNGFYAGPYNPKLSVINPTAK